MTKFVKTLTERAAQIASEGRGLPLPDFVDYAEHLLTQLVGYRQARLQTHAQDVDYLARQLQATYDMLQDSYVAMETKRFWPEDEDGSDPR